MQRGAHRGRPGPDPGGRQVAACTDDRTPLGTFQIPPTTTRRSRSASVNVSPMSMAAAYATPPRRHLLRSRSSLTKIVDDDGPVAAGAVGGMPSGDIRARSRRRPTTSCRACSPARTAAASWHRARELPGGGQDRHLQRGERQRHAVRRVRRVHHHAGRLRLGVQPGLARRTDTMTGQSACYRAGGGDQDCPGEMFGANAPGSTWHMTFDHANLTGSHDFQAGSSE